VHPHPYGSAAADDKPAGHRDQLACLSKKSSQSQLLLLGAGITEETAAKPAHAFLITPGALTA